jgi:hypothetical protein
MASTPGGIVRPTALGGLEVDYQFEFGWSHNRHICRFVALENAVGRLSSLKIRSTMEAARSKDSLKSAPES